MRPQENDPVDLKTCVSLCYFITEVCHFLSSDTKAEAKHHHLERVSL